MIPVKFKGHNAVYGKGQPEYQELPVHMTEESVTSVWELSDEEIDELVLSRRLKITQLNFGQALQPIRPEVMQEHDLY